MGSLRLTAYANSVYLELMGFNLGDTHKGLLRHLINKSHSFTHFSSHTYISVSKSVCI